MEQAGRLLIVAGAVAVLIGAMLIFGDRLGLRLGRLPLDFRIERESFSFYFPLGTSILISLAISGIFMLVGRR